MGFINPLQKFRTGRNYSNLKVSIIKYIESSIEIFRLFLHKLEVSDTPGT
jgi:hypothetical protein